MFRPIMLMLMFHLLKVTDQPYFSKNLSATNSNAQKENNSFEDVPKQDHHPEKERQPPKLKQLPNQKLRLRKAEVDLLNPREPPRNALRKLAKPQPRHAKRKVP